MLKELRGVEKVVSGYSGGGVPNPGYTLVSTGLTGHAEAVQITFDPKQISYEDLLNIFFASHDPTTMNRQGADVGPQYRSAVFYHTPAQEKSARKVIAELERKKLYEGPIVTEVVPFKAFYPAEDYHQDYFKKNPDEGYCRVVIKPKLIKFREKFFDRLKK
jgi:peptide-methionine (S)-S-oxide reductase